MYTFDYTPPPHHTLPSVSCGTPPHGLFSTHRPLSEVGYARQFARRSRRLDSWGNFWCVRNRLLLGSHTYRTDAYKVIVTPLSYKHSFHRRHSESMTRRLDQTVEQGYSTHCTTGKPTGLTTLCRPSLRRRMDHQRTWTACLWKSRPAYMTSFLRTPSDFYGSVSLLHVNWKAN